MHCCWVGPIGTYGQTTVEARDSAQLFQSRTKGPRWPPYDQSSQFKQRVRDKAMKIHRCVRNRWRNASTDQEAFDCVKTCSSIFNRPFQPNILRTYHILHVYRLCVWTSFVQFFLLFFDLFNTEVRWASKKGNRGRQWTGLVWFAEPNIFTMGH